MSDENVYTCEELKEALDYFEIEYENPKNKNDLIDKLLKALKESETEFSDYRIIHKSVNIDVTKNKLISEIIDIVEEAFLRVILKN